jgi:hypothetical protein
MSPIESAQLIPMQSVPAEIQRLELLAANACLLVLWHPWCAQPPGKLVAAAAKASRIALAWQED